MGAYMGDIGEDQKEFEFEPFPESVPEPIAVPEREPVGVPA